ncbi:MAG: peroxiredoxin [Xanthomonadales bacterium]|jgi:peroxiredoxin|nr:peroxiredoxin [Xanthomonadales bacterium]
MAIQIGDRIPDARVATMADGQPATLDTGEIFAGKTVLLFGVPGAFTPTCSARHLPGYIEQFEALRAHGIDIVACLSVNDAYVMGAWSASAGAENILMLADGNADFTRALGLDIDSSAFCMGVRARRFALVAKDGIVTDLFVEEPGDFRVSSAENVLAKLESR